MTYTSKYDFARKNPYFTAVCDTNDRAAWLKARSGYIGASDAAAILGENPWSSAMDLYADKLQIDSSGDHDPPEPAYWGLRFQDILISEFQKRTKIPAHPWEELVVSKERPWQSATCDAVTGGPGDEGILEVKCTRLSWNWDEGLPPYVFAQIQHQLSVTGFSRAHVAVLFNGNAFYQKAVPRAEEYIQFLNEKELEFWDRLKAFEPPDPDASDSCKKALARLFPRDNGERVVLDPKFTELDAQLVGLKDEYKEIGTSIAGLENQFRAEIGDATEGICSDGTIYTNKLQKRKEFVSKATEFRRLLRTGGKR